MSDKICTWKDCNNTANNSQLDKNGKEWANLCDIHHNKLENDICNPIPKKILRSWVLASGGAQKITDSMFK